MSAADFAGDFSVKWRCNHSFENMISDVYTKCHLCKNYILWSEYDQHITNCVLENDFKKCPLCDKYVPPFALKDHDCKTCGMKSKLINVNNDDRCFGDKGAKPKHPKMSEFNPTETCMNCKEKIPVLELSHHKQVCVKILIKRCKHCDEELKGDDSEENHLQNCKVYNHSISETELLSKHFKDLLTSENCWDTVLQVGSKEFKVHKTILIARSSVFSAMFQHDTEEKKTGIVKIADCDPDSIQQFLEYLYCGKLKHFSSDIALHLYTISDKYNVQELKIFCIKYLIKNITVQNICEVVILADMYDETELFSATEDVFNKNFKEIVMTSEWETLTKKNFRLANKLLIGKAKAE